MAASQVILRLNSMPVASRVTSRLDSTLAILILFSVFVQLAIGLFASTTIRNLSENHTELTVQTLLRSLTREPKGFYAIASILTNAHFRVGKLYTSTCSSWSERDFLNAFQYSIQLHPLQRDRILGKNCLENLPFSQKAFRYMRNHSIPCNLPNVIGSRWGKKEWTKILSTKAPEYIPDWCMRIPKTVLTKDFLKSIDLPYIMGVKCLRESYRNKNDLIAALNLQVANRDHRSLLKLASTLRMLEHDRAKTVRTKMRQRICDVKSEDIFHQINAKAMGCAWSRNVSTDQLLSSMLEMENLDEEILVVALRTWIKIVGISNIILAFNRKTKPFSLSYSNDAIVLLHEISSESIASQKAFFDGLGLNIEYIAYHAPFNIWKGRGENQLRIYSMPLAWRLEYFRGWKMHPQGCKSRKNRYDIRPLHYWSIKSFSWAQEKLSRILKKHQFKMSPILPDGSMVIYPETSVPEQILKFVINTMVYNIVHNGVDVVRFDPVYCLSIQMNTALNFSHSDLGDADCASNSSCSSEDLDVLCLSTQRKLFSEIHKQWQLTAVVEESKFCDFLASDIKLEIQNSVIACKDTTTIFFENSGCPVQ